MNEREQHTILAVHASPRRAASQSRALGEELARRLVAAAPTAQLVTRDLADGIDFVDDAWIAASAAPAERRSAEQAERLALSDTLVAELVAAKTLIITTPIYNFGVPAVLKAWIDQVARARTTFRYTAEGSTGLLGGRRAILVITSGGTRVGGEFDYASGFLRQVLSFIGIEQVDVVAADGLAIDAPARLADARRQIAALVAERRAA